MTDLAERIRAVRHKYVNSINPADAKSDAVAILMNDAPTILAGLAALEALDQAVAILKGASNIMLPPESNRQINNVRAQLRKLKAAIQSKDAKP